MADKPNPKDVIAEIIKSNREFMKGYQVSDFNDPQNDFHHSDQQRGIHHPPVQKEYDKESAKIIALPEFGEDIIKQPNIVSLIRNRRSRRKYTSEPLSLEELSFLLWSTQAISKVAKSGVWSIRTVPSAGARHPFETYLIANHVKGLDTGVYRYLPMTHELLFEFNNPKIQDDVRRASYGEDFVANAPVCFVWSCIPYRGEWRYAAKSHKSMLLDAGHICQNLYLAAESIGCGTCAIGGYHQGGFDDLLRLDGEDEFTVYLAPVGRIAP